MHYYQVRLYRTELKWNSENKQCIRTLAQTNIARTLLQAITEGDRLLEEVKLRDRNQGRISLKKGHKITYKIDITLFTKFEIAKILTSGITLPSIVDTIVTPRETLLCDWDDYWENTIYDKCSTIE